MTNSLPTKEIYNVDVPRVKNLKADFRYNYYVKDETTNDSGALEQRVISKRSEEQNNEFLQYATTHAPRWVQITFDPIKGLKASSEKVPKFTNIISENIDNIIDEDSISKTNMLSMFMQNPVVGNKVYDFVSSSLLLHEVLDTNSKNNSPIKSAANFINKGYKIVDPDFINNVMSTNELSTGLFTTTTIENAIGNRLNTDVKNKQVEATKTTDNNDNKLISIPNWVSKCGDVGLNIQLNTAFVKDIVEKSYYDNSAQFTVDFSGSLSSLANIQDVLRPNNLTITDDDYQTMMSYIDYVTVAAAEQNNDINNNVTFVGYIIDKYEITPEGNVIEGDKIIVENPYATITYDFKVKYGSTYVYNVRTVALFEMISTDITSKESVRARFLVSSRQTKNVMIQCVENIPPPHPVDVDVNWNYTDNLLMLYWCLPTNPQRDIKYFQVFRRTSLNSPFELIKQYDFNDSNNAIELFDKPSPGLIEKVDSPTMNFIDYEFTKQSRFIYAIAAIDAHGLTSNYSAQFEITFDQYKNKIVKQLVVAPGAPREYPNFYVKADQFVDSMTVSGPSSKKMKLYFTPEYYNLYDNEGHDLDFMQTKQTGGSYKLLAINTDIQKSDTLNITIDASQLSQQEMKAQIQFGQRKIKPQ